MLTRSNDETLEVDPAHLSFVFQGVDAEGCKAKNTAAFHGGLGFLICARARFIEATFTHPDKKQKVAVHVTAAMCRLSRLMRISCITA